VNRLAQFLLVSLALLGLVCGLAHAKSIGSVQRAVLELPCFHEDRSPELAPAKSAQLKAIAEAIERHARDRREAAFVTAWGWHETAYSLRIMAGRCKPIECDRGRARGSHQGHRNGLSQADWDRMHGLENIDFQIAEATRRARSALAQCRGDVRGAFAALSGRGCEAKLKDIDARVNTFGRTIRRLQ